MAVVDDYLNYRMSESPTLMEIVAFNVRSQMKIKEYNPEKLVELSGLGRATIYRIIGAKPKPVRINNLERIAQTLGVQPYELLKKPATANS